MVHARFPSCDNVNSTAMLLAHGARIDIEDAWEMTPLHDTFRPGHGSHKYTEQMAILLIQSDLNTAFRLLEKKDKRHCTPRDYALENGLGRTYLKALASCGCIGDILSTPDLPTEWLAWFADNGEMSSEPQRCLAKGSDLERDLNTEHHDSEDVYSVQR